MRRILLLLVAVAFLVPLALSAGSAKAGGPDVFCGPGCDTGGGYPPCPVGYQYAGYSHAQPGIGQSVSTVMGEYFGTLRNGGFIGGWVGVSSNARDSHGPLRWIQAGLLQDADGLKFYVEIRVPNQPWQQAHQFPVKTLGAQTSTQYIFTIYHTGPSAWTATIATYPDGQVLYTVPYSGAVDAAQYEGETDNITSDCNVMQFDFWALTWPTTQMNPSSNNPYWIDQNDPSYESFAAVGP